MLEWVAFHGVDPCLGLRWFTLAVVAMGKFQLVVLITDVVIIQITGFILGVQV